MFTSPDDINFEFGVYINNLLVGVTGVYINSLLVGVTCTSIIAIVIIITITHGTINK